MNSEMKIIIKAVTDGAKKSIKGVSDEVKNLSKNGKSGSSSFSASMGTMAKGAAVAATAVIGALTAIGAALVNLGKSSMEYRNNQAKLTSAFQAMGFSATQASKSYNEFYRFLGESDKAVEAAAHIAKLTTTTEDASKWGKIAQGVYATFGDSLPIEGFTEAANETARVGKVTGVMADALNWAGVSEDEMNAKLATTNSLREREQMLLETLGGKYNEIADIFERNNADIIAYNESQARLDASMAQAGKAVQPLLTALNNLGAAFFNAITPALNAIIPLISTFVGWITTAVKAVLQFFNILSGGKGAVAEIGTAVSSVGGGFGSAASGAGNLANNTGSAAKQAEKLKRSTSGFDELNKVTDNSSSASGGSSGGGGGGASAPGFATGGGGVIDTSGMNSALDGTSKKVEEFIAKLKGKVGELKTLFQPTITSWSEAFNGIDWEGIGANFSTGLENIKTSFTTLSTYVTEEFIPGLTNSFSENLAPVFGDVFNFAALQGSGAFSYISAKANEVINDIIIPTMENWKTVASDIFSGIGDAWDEHGATALDEADTAIQGVYDTLDYLYEELVKPVVDYIENEFMDMWKNDLKPVFDNIVKCLLEIWTNLLELWNKVIKPIVDWIIAYLVPKIKDAIKTIVDKVKLIITTVSGVISGITTTLNGIVKFITGIFTGNWKKAWEGVKDIFKGIFESLFAVIKAPLNAIIGGINSVIRGVVSGANTAIRALNRIKITVPDWVPEIGGKTFGFNISELSAPQIPLLATGGIVTKDTLARIGEGNKKEAVLPLEQNTQWMDVLADRIAQRNGAPSKIVLTVDGKELGWANINSINNITRQTGNLPLVFA